MREPAGGRWRPEGGAAAQKILCRWCGRRRTGIYLLAHGEPHDPCPVAGCGGGPCSFYTGEASRVVCSLQPHQHGPALALGRR